MSPVYRPSTTDMRVATQRSAPIIAAIGSTTSCPDADRITISSPCARCSAINACASA
jgi:hypothetical protein